MYAAESAAAQQQEDAKKACLVSLDARNSSTAPSSHSQSISTSRSYSLSTVASAALPSHTDISISGRRHRSCQWSQPVDDGRLDSEKVDVESSRESEISSSSVTRPKPSPSLPTSASQSYHYHSPAMVVDKSTDSILDTRIAQLQQSKTETRCAVEAVTSPEVAPGTNIDAITVTVTTGDLDRVQSSMISRLDVTASRADSGHAELPPDQQPQLTSGNDVGAVRIKKVVSIETLTSVYVQGHSETDRCLDDSQQAGSKAMFTPSGELAPDSCSRFTPTHQMEPPEPNGFGISEQVEPLLLSEQCRVDEVKDRTLDDAPVLLHHPASERLNEVDLASSVIIHDTVALSEPIDIPTDDVFLPELVQKSNNDVASVEPEMIGVLVEGATARLETAAGVCEDAIAMGGRLVRRDSFNRPDSPMFHQLMDLPRDSVILRNRQRRRRHDLNRSSSSSSSSSSSFLSNSRRVIASGAVQCYSVTLRKCYIRRTF